MEESGTLSQLIEQIKAEYSHALFLAFQTGNVNPIATVLEANDAELKSKFGVSVQELLNISDADMEKYGNIQFGANQAPALVVDPPAPKGIDKSAWIVMASIFTGFVGIGLIISAVRN